MTKAFSYINVVKTYPGFRLGPLSLELESGSVMGLVGPNGSGKTTTIHCLTGLVRADGGEIEVFGRRNDPNNTSWKLDIGYVGDTHFFYEKWSGERNLRFLSRFYPNWSESYAAELSRRFDLPLDKRAKDLSRGNRVKLALVAALAHRPRLLLLDEPTVGLDPVARSELLDILFEVVESEERAIFYSTHILSDINRLADDLAFINNGRLLLRTPKEFLTDKWRRITFRHSRQAFEVGIFESHKRSEMEHQIVSTDYQARLRELEEIGAEDILVSRMSIDEIAVEILKGARQSEEVANLTGKTTLAGESDV